MQTSTHSNNAILAHGMTKIGSDKRGNPRIWIEGKKLEQAGFTPQARYQMKIDTEKMRIELRVNPEGHRIVSHRQRRGSDIPIVDIVNAETLKPFVNAETLRIDFTSGTIIIEPAAREARRMRREARTLGRLKNNQPLRTGSVSTGLGVLSYAIHQGLATGGLKSEMAFSVEIDQEYQDLCAERNPAWHQTTKAINMPLQEFAFDPVASASVEEVDILEAGIPCTAHSIAGRSKKRLAMPEHDPVAGNLVVGFLAIVAKVNPTVVIVENVPQYADSASFAILTNQLTEWGYHVDHTILRGEEHGCLEHRNRMAMIATSRSMQANVVAQIEEMTARAEAFIKPVLGDVLEDIEPDSGLWSKMEGLKKKEIRDREAGKGFRMQILEPKSEKVGTIGRGYAKIRSTEPKLKHPSNPDLMRQFTPVEHARIKGIPEEMVEGLSVTTAHEMLGQSIVAAPFRALGEAIGRELCMWKGGEMRQAKILRPMIQKAQNNAKTEQEPEQLGLF